MKKNIFIISLFLLIVNLFSDETDDLYGWIKNEKIRDNAIKAEKFRKNAQSKMFFSGEVCTFFFYHPAYWQGDKNDHAADFAYEELDFTQKSNYSDGEGGYKSSSWGAIDTGFYGSISLSAPFIDSKNPIFTGNKMSIKLDWAYYWMQASIGLSYIFQPVPFFYTTCGVKIGTGWDFLWNSNGSPILSGLALNTKDSINPKSIPGQGPVVNFFLSNTLQMDFSALPVIPEKSQRWTHIIVQATASFNFQALVTIKEDQPYHYITSNNLFNGWSFSSNFVLGYLIPVIEDKTDFQSFRRLVHRNFSIFPLLNTIIDVPLSHFNDSRMSNEGWGSDFITVTLQPSIIFGLPYNFSVMLISEFVTAPRYKENTLGNLYIKDMIYEDWYMYFSKIGVVYSWGF